ncbi:MAG: hypothetical protein WBB76_03415 [Gaiellaceae bacterium]
MTFADYGAVRFALMELRANLDPKAPPVPPTAWERFQTRVRSFF